MSTGIDCKLGATIYARVSERKILTWIQKVTETSPLIMVIGGYASFKLKKLGKTRYPTSGPTWDIELLSEKSNERIPRKMRKTSTFGHFGPKWPILDSFWPKWAKPEFFQKSVWNIFFRC